MYPGQMIPVDCQPQQQYAQQQAIPQQSGSLGGLLGGIGSILQGGGTAQPDKYRMIKFFRVNEKVEVPEEAIAINEPLDELRIKVAKWLYN